MGEVAMSEKIEGSEEKVLESWKEIAAYLKRDVRTVIRWEKSEGLPVHRHLHQARSSVYAHPSEIDAWAATRQPRREKVAAWRRPIPALVFAAVLMLSLLLVADAPFGCRRGQQAPGSSAMTTRRVWSPEPGGCRYGQYRWPLPQLWNSTGNLVVQPGHWRDLRFTMGPAPLATEADYTVSPDGRQVAYAFWNGHYDLRRAGQRYDERHRLSPPQVGCGLCRTGRLVSIEINLAWWKTG
jgi:hypothetical protein